MICPKCGKPAWKLSDRGTKIIQFRKYVYSRYRHPKNQYGKEKTCYTNPKKVIMGLSHDGKLVEVKRNYMLSEFLKISVRNPEKSKFTDFNLLVPDHCFNDRIQRLHDK